MLSAISQAEPTGHWDETSFADELKLSWSRVEVLEAEDAEAEPVVIGYVVYWLVEREIELLNIATRPDWRRRGVAARLLAHLKEIAWQEGAESIVLEVRASNEAAQRLYARAGFGVAGVRKGYYQAESEDAVLMCCSVRAREETLP